MWVCVGSDDAMTQVWGWSSHVLLFSQPMWGFKIRPLYWVPSTIERVSVPNLVGFEKSGKLRYDRSYQTKIKQELAMSIVVLKLPDVKSEAEARYGFLKVADLPKQG